MRVDESYAPLITERCDNSIAGLHVVHLPFYKQNPYQSQLIQALRNLGLEVFSSNSRVRFFKQALFDWQASILHFHWTDPFVLRPGRVAMAYRAIKFLLQVAILKLAGKRIVWTVHNLKNHENKHLRMELLFNRVFVRLADGVIVHCDCAKTEVSRVFRVGTRARIRVIPHATFIGVYPNEVARSEARHHFGYDSKEKVFLLFGLLRSYKGALDLIEHFQALNLPAVRLLIAGATHDKKLASIIEERVANDQSIKYVPGFVADEDVQLYMNAADVVVFPYRDILASSAVLLAMSFGKACIAPRRGCIPETLGENGGILYESGDPDGLRSAICSAAGDDFDPDLVGTRNGDRVQQWTWNEAAALTQDLYAQCLAKKSPVSQMVESGERH